MSEWISVKDRLPTRENKGKMLACTNDGWVFCPGGVPTVGDEIDDSPDGIGWWMPFPEPPEEVKK